MAATAPAPPAPRPTPAPARQRPARRPLAGRAPSLLGWGLTAAVPLVFLGVFFAYPVGTLVARGFFPDGAADLSGFAEVFARPRTWRVIGITLAQAAAGTAVSVLLGLPGAYLLYRCSFPDRGLVRAAVTVPFVLPTVVVGVAFRSLLGAGGPLGFLGLDGTFAAVVAALVFFNYAVVVRTVGGMWARLDPRAEEAARALGASRPGPSPRSPCRRWRPRSPPPPRWCSCSAPPPSAWSSSSAARGTGRWRPRSGCRPPSSWTCGRPPCSPSSRLAVVAAALAVAGRTRARQERALRLRDTPADHPLRLLAPRAGAAGAPGRTCCRPP